MKEEFMGMSLLKKFTVILYFANAHDGCSALKPGLGIYNATRVLTFPGRIQTLRSVHFARLGCTLLKDYRLASRLKTVCIIFCNFSPFIETRDSLSTAEISKY